MYTTQPKKRQHRNRTRSKCWPSISNRSPIYTSHRGIVKLYVISDNLREPRKKKEKKNQLNMCPSTSRLWAHVVALFALLMIATSLQFTAGYRLLGDAAVAAAGSSTRHQPAAKFGESSILCESIFASINLFIFC
jgi:hypothetical protein